MASIELMDDCRSEHTSCKSRTKPEPCLVCKDLVEVDVNGKCTCCGHKLKKFKGKTKDIEKLDRIFLKIAPIFEIWRQKPPTDIPLMVPVALGIGIYHIDFEILRKFVNCHSIDERLEVIKQIKRSAPYALSV